VPLFSSKHLYLLRYVAKKTIYHPTDLAFLYQRISEYEPLGQAGMADYTHQAVYHVCHSQNIFLPQFSKNKL
jgi:hypothetical protein